MTVPNATELQIMFESPTILLEKEVLAYSFGTFVADCGGVLGLFIGFNFLMIWDLLFLLYVKFKSSSVSRGSHRRQFSL